MKWFLHFENALFRHHSGVCDDLLLERRVKNTESTGSIDTAKRVLVDSIEAVLNIQY